jgi:hypothetical protein
MANTFKVITKAGVTSADVIYAADIALSVMEIT